MSSDQLNQQHIPRKLITQKLATAKNNNGTTDYIRFLFVPTRITKDSLSEAAAVYSMIDGLSYDTVIVVESFEKRLDKRLSMPSVDSFETHLGNVPANDYLRNEFCDEDDDFFINDEAHTQSMSLYDQLPMLQCALDDFKVVSIQIAEEEPDIVLELAAVLEEITATRNALIVFCCDLASADQKFIDKIEKLISASNRSYILNFLKTDAQKIWGKGPLVTGMLMAHSWELDIHFMNGNNSGPASTNVTSGYGKNKSSLWQI